MGQYPPTRSSSQKLILDIASKLQSRSAQASGPNAAPAKDHALKVVCISDTHNLTPEVPYGDLLLHAGDLSGRGTFDNVQAQLNWLNDQSHEHKVVIAGNHDLVLDGSVAKKDSSNQTAADLDWGSLIYLRDEAIDLVFSNGRKLKIYGNPYTPRFGDFAFQYPPGEDYWANKLPEDADIVMTHGPPLCHLDRNTYGGHVGCPSLLKELYRARPRLAVCGHIHESAGQELLTYDRVQSGLEQVLLNKAGWGTLASMALGAFTDVKGRSKPTRLVNAAMMKDYSILSTREAIVIEM